MKNFWTKTAALFLLAIFAVNPLHAILHAGHDHGSHIECSSSDCSPDKKFENSFNHDEDSHDCYLCQNKQDRIYDNPQYSENQVKYNLEKQTKLSTYNTILISKGIFFVDSRGPPSFI